MYNQRVQERFAAESYFDSGQARTDLLTSGMQLVNIYSHKSRWEEKKGLFGRGGQWVDVVDLSMHGWIIGEFLWEYNDGKAYGGSKVKQNCITALLDISRGEQEGFNLVYGRNRGLAHVQPCSGGYEAFSKGYESFLSDWTAVMQAVKRLAGLPI